MMIFLKATIRYVRCAIAEAAAKRADACFARCWHSALEREERVRRILGARREESTDEAAWRVVSNSRT